MSDPVPHSAPAHAPALPYEPQTFGLLRPEDRQMLQAALGPAHVLQSGEDLAMEGDRATGCTIVLDGVLCRYKLLSEGTRQILGFPIAGDLIGPAGLMLGRMDHSVRALTPATIATVPRHAFLELVATQPHIAQAIWREVLVDASIAHEWLANVGQRPAYHRIAHLICEMRVRFEAAGIAAGPRFAWPITQGHMAEATGLSSVHVNRILQQLRTDGLITLALGVLTIQDWAELQRVGDFTPDYLFPHSRTEGVGTRYWLGAPGAPGWAAGVSITLPPSSGPSGQERLRQTA